ncbi:MAG TPA: right-handed parallel beta-helix repeat-containing protein, partial [Dehalococcoidia bacterium]
MIELLMIAAAATLLGVGFYSKPAPPTRAAASAPLNPLQALLAAITGSSSTSSSLVSAGPVVTPTMTIAIPSAVLNAAPAIAAALPTWTPATPIKPAPVSSAAPTPSSGARYAPVFSLNTNQSVNGVNLDLAADQVGILVNGDHHRISGITFRGGWQGLLIDGATSDTTVDGFTYTDDNAAGLGIYVAAGGKAAPNDTISLNNVVVVFRKQGQHCIRIYAATNLRMTNCTFDHQGTYGGATINCKQVTGFYMQYIKSTGRPIGFGANETPSEVDYYCEDGVIEDCDFSATLEVIFHSGVRNLTFRRCRFTQTGHPVAHLQFKGAYLGRPQPYNINFEDCVFAGGSKVAEGKTEAATFTRCTWN